MSVVSITISAIGLLISICAIVVAKKAYESPLKACFYCNDYKISPIDRTVEFTIENHGEFAHIVKLKELTNNISINHNLPIDIVRGGSSIIIVKYHGNMTGLEEDTIKVGIMYLDKDGNKHNSTLVLKEKRCSITACSSLK